MSFLDGINTEKLYQIINSTESNSEHFYNLVDNIVVKYSKDLDDFMRDLHTEVTGQDAITTDAAERYYAELTNLLYFMTSNLERLNIYSDMAGAAAKEVYSKAYLAAATEKDEKGKSLRTVGENQSIAEVSAQYENISSSVYQHVYRYLRLKFDIAMETVAMLKNIIKRRMNEEYLSGFAGGK